MLKRIVGLAAFSLLFLAAGCSEKSSQPELTDTPNFTEEFGGYTATDETAGFGDPELVATEAEEEEIDDDIVLQPEVVSVMTNPRSSWFHLRAVWGQLRLNPDQTELTDWTGHLSLNSASGAVVVRRLIRFEPGQDHLVLSPSHERARVDWVSFTSIHNDGIAVDLIVPPLPPILDTTWNVPEEGDSTIVSIDTIGYQPIELTFETGPYTCSFTLEELATLDTIVFVDEDSNAVALHAYQWHPNSCPRGVLAGRWGYDQNGNGVFAGLWRSRAGVVSGYLKGHYGLNEQGEKVFFGKWIDRNGKFQGFLRGFYDLHPHSEVQNSLSKCIGWFAGKIFNADRNEIGVLGGRCGATQSWPGGWFQGRWKTYCAALPEIDNGIGNLDDGF
ncbi:MAG: hypothetical protein DRP45_05475 [Candidatus Zixiibacteriota bacterium]|nr:MAG: hypothetical protein DRP45_05475 [candidate division Zixibacteria bacterium]